MYDARFLVNVLLYIELQVHQFRYFYYFFFNWGQVGVEQDGGYVATEIGLCRHIVWFIATCDSCLCENNHAFTAALCPPQYVLNFGA